MSSWLLCLLPCDTPVQMLLTKKSLPNHFEPNSRPTKIMWPPRTYTGFRDWLGEHSKKLQNIKDELNFANTNCKSTTKRL